MPNDAAWRTKVQFVRDGEPVSGSTVSRPDSDLALRSEYLKTRVDEAELGESLVAHAVPCDPALQAGEGVYWDASRSRFGRCLSASVRDVATGMPDAAPSAQFLGLCIDKLDAPNTADIVVGGRTRTAPALISGSPTPGRYYMSPSDPGKFTKTRPTSGLPVLFFDGHWSYVSQQPQGLLDNHTHRTFDLVCRAAGTPVLISEIHHIADPDPTLAGWLPADHPVFEGKAPEIAVFGYNLAKHPDLQAIWPPVPLESIRLDWDYARTLGGALMIPHGEGGLYVADSNGLWWLSSCYGDVPWSEAPDLIPPTEIGSSSGFGSCPRAESMRLVLSCIDPAGAGAGMVNSLRPANGSPMRVTDESGNNATRGNLLIDIDWGASITYDTLLREGSAVKEIDVDGHLKSGPILTGIKAGTSVTLAGGETFVDGVDTYRKGLVTINAQVGGLPRELSSQLVRLQDAEEGFVDALGVHYITLPAGRSASFISRFDIPPDGLPGSVVMVLRGHVYTGTTGTFPTITATVRIIPRPSPPSSGSVVLGSTSSSAWTFPVSGRTATAGRMIEVETATPIAVTAGSVVLVTLSRASGDGFGGEVGFIRLALIIQAA